MHPRYTEFAIIRPKSPTSRVLLYRRATYEVYDLTGYNLCCIINNSVNDIPVTEDTDLSKYVFCGTRYGRDEYCHPDDFDRNIEIYVKNITEKLTKKYNMI